MCMVGERGAVFGGIAARGNGQIAYAPDVKPIVSRSVSQGKGARSQGETTHCAVA